MQFNGHSLPVIFLLTSIILHATINVYFLIMRTNMKTISFIAYKDKKNLGFNICNRESIERELVINCTGNFKTQSDFHSINPTGRVDYYLMLIISGALEFTSEFGKIKAGAGTLILHPPKVAYEYQNIEEGETNYLWVHFTGSQVEKRLDKYGIKYFPQVNDLTVDNGIISAFKNIFAAFAIHDEFRESELSALLDKLLVSIARGIHEGKNKTGRPMLRAIEYINSSYDEKIKIPDLASLENLSVSRFNTLFKITVGKSPTEYITELRINAACELLSNTKLTVAEIGRMVGYEDSHFFSRIFKSHKGESPTSYREHSFAVKGGDF